MTKENHGKMLKQASQMNIANLDFDMYPWSHQSENIKSFISFMKIEILIYLFNISFFNLQYYLQYGRVFEPCYNIYF